jgi:hypothetical protein
MLAKSLSLSVWVAILCELLFAGCSFDPGAIPNYCGFFDSIPITPLSSANSQVVFQTPGTIIAIHGSGTAKLDSGESAYAIKVEQSLPIPRWANRATVFLNGWKLSYLGGDQHVLALGTAVAKIRTTIDPMTRSRGQT